MEYINITQEYHYLLLRNLYVLRKTLYHFSNKLESEQHPRHMYEQTFMLIYKTISNNIPNALAGNFVFTEVGIWGNYSC